MVFFIDGHQLPALFGRIVDTVAMTGAITAEALMLEPEGLTPVACFVTVTRDPMTHVPMSRVRAARLRLYQTAGQQDPGEQQGSFKELLGFCIHNSDFVG
jgi:hypothetical protein